jgi:hypothetical protein
MFDRVYFENAESGLRVTRTSQMTLHNYGPPGQHWRVGLPVPGALGVSTEVADLTPQFSLRWENDGELLSEVVLTGIEEITPGREFLLHYDPNANESQGIFGGGDTATIDSLEFVQEVSYNFTGSYVEGGGTDAQYNIPYTVSGTLGDRVACVANWGSDWGYSDNLPSVAYRGVGSEPEWFRLGLYQPGYGVGFIEYHPMQRQGDLPFDVTRLGPGVLEVSGAGAGFVARNVLRIKKNGQWMNFSSAFGASSDGRLVARVSGTLNGESFTASSATDTGEAHGVVVSMSEDSSGVMRVKLRVEGTSSSINVSTAYAVTFVNDWLEESAPSPALVLELEEGSSARLSCVYSGFPDGRPLLGMNVYRTYGATDAYILVNSSPIPAENDGVFRFTDHSEEPGNVTTLDTADWDPPNPNLHGLTYAGNGFFAGAVGKDLYFSEPYHPHAWPYAMTFTHAIIGIEAIEGGLLVTTLAKPYVVYGTHPEEMAQQAINAEQAGLTQRALIRVEGNAVYASNDGLVSVSGGQASPKESQSLFTRQDWRGAYRAVFRNLALGAHDGKIVGVVDPAYPAGVTNTQGFVIRLDEAAGTYTRLEFPAQDARSLGLSLVPEVDAMYVCREDGFAEYGAGEELPFVWHSKEFSFPKPETFGAVGIDCSAGVLVEIFCDRRLVYQKTIEAGGMYVGGTFRLPSIPSHKRWSVRFSGTGKVVKFEMGSSFAELKEA